MTQEQKQPLLTALCGYLPYGVICHTEKGDGHLCSINQTIFGTEYGFNINPLKRDYFNDSETEEQVVKPYLRPMPSMTEEEEDEYQECGNKDIAEAYIHLVPNNRMDWLNKNKFDYRGLIPMGLALEALPDMYKAK